MDLRTYMPDLLTNIEKALGPEIGPLFVQKWRVQQARASMDQILYGSTPTTVIDSILTSLDQIVACCPNPDVLTPWISVIHAFGTCLKALPSVVKPEQSPFVRMRVSELRELPHTEPLSSNSSIRSQPQATVAKPAPSKHAEDRSKTYRRDDRSDRISHSRQTFAQKAAQQPSRSAKPTGKPLPHKEDKIFPGKAHFEEYAQKHQQGVMHVYAQRCSTKNCKYCLELFRRTHFTRCVEQCFGQRGTSTFCPGHDVGWYPHVSSTTWRLHKPHHGPLASVTMKTDVTRYPASYEHQALDYIVYHENGLPDYGSEAESDYAAEVGYQFVVNKRTRSPDEGPTSPGRKKMCSPLPVPEHLVSHVVCDASVPM